MTDPKPDTDEAREAEAHGERPDLGHTPDALKDSLTGSDMGSDTRAGSLRGGSATGSDDDPDQDRINEALASEGMANATGPEDDPESPTEAGPDAVTNTGPADQDPAEGKRGDDDADAATG